jgi:sulfoxide reductase heme-binding subunit YedZ
MLKVLVFSLCLLPLVWLSYALFTDQLGANPIEVVTRRLGEWGLQLLIVTLCMTPLKDLLQKPWPIQLRRMLGLFSFFYLLLHLFSYLWMDQFFDWLAIWTDIKKRPFITVGMLSFLGLIPLAVTSNKWSQRRLGRKWRQLHLLVYPITILAVLHFYMLVKLDELRPLVFAGCLGLLLGYRWLKKTFPAQ